jgi:hypothetical protein
MAWERARAMRMMEQSLYIFLQWVECNFLGSVLSCGVRNGTETAEKDDLVLSKGANVVRGVCLNGIFLFLDVIIKRG